MNSDRFVSAPPSAGPMLEALRGLGYSAASALADILDNSISAQAKQINVDFSWCEGASFVSVLDDGVGMSKSGLLKAMHLGGRSPLEERLASDLGRFGMGLKTASFSQCRRVTVASLQAGETSCFRWDLDALAKHSESGWFMLEGPAIGSEWQLEKLSGQKSGTLVLWEVVDRIVTERFSKQDFLDLIDSIERHFAMIFHRYLEGPSPRLKLRINGRPVTPWNPFLISHSATWSSPEVTLKGPGGDIQIQCHVLPHKDRLSSAQYDSMAGPHGWTAQQGFYVYRNERLLVAGSWLNLGQGRSWTKEEAHRLARIRLDISNSSDADWKIDIRKAVARPPVACRAELVRLADDARSRARRVFAHRGQVVRSSGKQVQQAWRAEHTKDGVRYRIDETHPAIKAVMEEAGHLSGRLQTMLRVIEETIPVQRIWLDTTESKEPPLTGFVGNPPAEVAAVISQLYRNLVLRKGLPSELARQRLLQTEPFHLYPELVAALPDEPEVEQPHAQ